MARKRAPGAGRKPQGEYANRTAPFTMRMSKDLRVALEREAKRSGRVLSQEVEHRLRGSLPASKKDEWRSPRHYALGRLLARAALGVELSTGVVAVGRGWLDNAFAAQAVRAALLVIMDRLMPDEPLEIPEAVKKSAANFARLPNEHAAEMAAFCSTPAGVGSSIANGLLSDLEIYEFPPLDLPDNIFYSDAFNLMPRIRKELGLAKKGAVS
jgi:hypothetical protein